MITINQGGKIGSGIDILSEGQEEGNGQSQRDYGI